MSFIEKITTVFDPSNCSAFGTLEVAEPIFLSQGDYVYGLNNQIWNTAVTSGSGATVSTSSGVLNIQSGTASNGYAYITSKKAIRYRGGQGVVCRFTPLFTNGLTNNIQLWGIGSINNNLPYDGYFFGYNGTSFGIAYYNGGVATWTPRASFNGDTLNGSGASGMNWNTAFGTPVMIKFPYLGYGDVFFFVQNPLTGAWILAHTIRYANTSAATQLANPTMQFLGFTLNSGNTSNVTCSNGCFGLAVSGQNALVANPKWAMDNNKTAITTETCLLNLQNCTTYNGVPNRGIIRIRTVSFAATATAAIAILRMKINGTIGGSPSYTCISGSTGDNGVTITSGNSVVSYDTAGTTISGGVFQQSFSVSGTSNQVWDLTSNEIYLAPGDIASFTGFSTASAGLSVSVGWSEDI